MDHQPGRPPTSPRQWPPAWPLALPVAVTGGLRPVRSTPPAAGAADLSGVPQGRRNRRDQHERRTGRPARKFSGFRDDGLATLESRQRARPEGKPCHERLHPSFSLVFRRRPAKCRRMEGHAAEGLTSALKALTVRPPRDLPGGPLVSPSVSLHRAGAGGRRPVSKAGPCGFDSYHPCERPTASTRRADTCRGAHARVGQPHSGGHPRGGEGRGRDVRDSRHTRAAAGRPWACGDNGDHTCLAHRSSGFEPRRVHEGNAARPARPGRARPNPARLLGSGGRAPG